MFMIYTSLLRKTQVVSRDTRSSTWRQTPPRLVQKRRVIHIQGFSECSPTINLSPSRWKHGGPRRQSRPPIDVRHGRRQELLFHEFWRLNRQPVLGDMMRPLRHTPPRCKISTPILKGYRPLTWVCGWLQTGTPITSLKQNKRQKNGHATRLKLN